jgi:hypothetical protein
MELSELTKAFGNKKVPEILIELLTFDNTVSKDNWFSEGFEFSVDEENHLFKTYSENEDFLNSLIQFAQADGTGSTYAFWINDANKNLDTVPIVAFGSEGGYHIVSENIQALFKVLSYDVEPMIDWDSISYYKDSEDFEPSKYIDNYRNWLEKNHQILPTGNANEIVQNAQKKYQQEFKEWVGKYYSE